MGFIGSNDFDDVAEAIANPPANRPIARGVGNFGRKVCDSVSSNPGLYAPTILQGPIRSLCEPYWRNNDYDPPTEVSPFNGGQCPGVSYTVNFQNFDAGQPFGGPGVRSGLGPVGIRKEVTGGSQAFFITFQNSESQTISGPVSSNPNTVITSVVRQDGQPDDCGNPPGTFEPGPNPAPNPGPLPPGTGPSFDPRGNPIIILPPEVEPYPGVFIELPDGDINFGGGGGGGGPAQLPLEGSTGSGAGGGTGGGENDFPPAPEGERWVGCCINIISSPVGERPIPSSIPQDVYPYIVGNVRLKFQGVFPPAEYDTPVAIRQKTTCVWEPIRGLSPVGVFVNLLPFYEYSFTPYSVPKEQ